MVGTSNSLVPYVLYSFFLRELTICSFQHSLFEKIYITGPMSNRQLELGLPHFLFLCSFTFSKVTQSAGLLLCDLMAGKFVTSIIN